MKRMIQQPLFGGIFERNDDHEETLPYASSSATSKAAADEMPRESADSQRRMVFNFIDSRGPRGACRFEIEKALGLRNQSLCPRVLELIKQGRIYESTETRKTPRGRKAAVLKGMIEWRGARIRIGAGG